MGNDHSNGSPNDLETMKKYYGMSPGQVQLFKDKFELMADEDLTIDRSIFAQLMKLKENEVDKIFSFFDMSNDGRIDSHEFICALSLLAQATLKQKAELIFSLYDFDHNRTISKNELVILVKTTLTALGAMSQKGECSIKDAEEKSEDIFKRFYTNKDQSISLKKFQSLVSKDPEILKMLFSYGLISSEDLRVDFGGGDMGDMPDPDSDLEQEVQRSRLAFDQKVERKVGNEHKQGQFDEQDDTTTYQQFKQAAQGKHSKLWINQVEKGAPSNWKPNKGELNPPAVWMDLDYIYGFRCFDSRNNIKFTLNGDLVYHTAAVAIVLDTQKNSQRFFMEHTDDITCIDVFENMIVTGQVGLDPLICVWEVGKVSGAVFRGNLKNGVSNVAFSNDGKKIVAIGMDPEHCIVIYDVDKALQGRGSGKRDDFLISSGKGLKNQIFDVKFDKTDKTIIIASNKEVYFATYDSFTVRMTKGLWDVKTCPLSSVLCIGTVDTSIVTGTYKGQLLVWRGNRVTQSIEAHKGPVLCMHSKKNEPGLITGGKDGVVIQWDAQMKQKSKIIVQELNLKIINQRVCSVTENHAGTVQMIGTRGSDIIEISNQRRVVMRGHSEGFLRGLAVHPKLQQFYTIGEDNILGCWFIKDKKMMSCVKLDYPCRAIAISGDSRFLAVGSLNGTVLIIDPKTLIPTFNFKDRDSEVSCIKFSHDMEMLAVGHSSPACEIILYSIKNHFKKMNLLRGSPDTILSIDFSIDCKVIQVNDDSRQVLYYELGGEGIQKVQPDGASKNRDEKWATYTSVYGWQVQGVWPQVSSGNDINAVDRSQKGDILVTADDYSGIKLFRYPAPSTGQGYNRYSGHAAHVSNVRFTAEDEYIISLGGADKSIFQWKFSFDRETQIESDLAADIPNSVIAAEYLRESMIDAVDDDPKVEVKLYLGPIKATIPKDYKQDLKRDNQLPQGNLFLSYIFGFKTSSYDGEALNLIKYLQNGKIVYPAGSVCVIMDPKDEHHPQTFFRLHKEGINAIAIHPKGSIVATGGRAIAMRMNIVPIYIWDAETKQVVSCITDFHLRCINAIQFTPDGAFLVTAGADEDNSIAVHDWSTSQLLCTAKTGRSMISGIQLRSQTEFIVSGHKMIKFFSMNGRNLKSQPGSLGSQFEPITTILIAFTSLECITGTLNGNLYLWKDQSASKAIKAHDGKVTSLVQSKQQVLSAGLDGHIKVWELQQGTLTLIGLLMENLNLPIISMDVRDNKLIVGTNRAEIFEIFLEKQPRTVQIMQGHFAGELWGLACSPNSQKCVTCGGDSMLRLWDLDTKKMLVVSQPFENDIRAVDWSSNGQLLAVGDIKGFIYLYDANNLTLLDKKSSKFTLQKSRSNMTWIEDIKFSPDCSKVAFGAHTSGSHLEVWELEGTKLNKQTLINLSLQGQLIHLDWASDNVHIVINSSKYELKFVNVSKAKDVLGPIVKDLQWSTCTSSLGFTVQGIYKTKEEYDVVSVCSSQNKQNIATGEFNGQISLFKYPAVCPAPQQNREYSGHASPVTRVRFSHDDAYLVSVSQLDRCVFVWETDFAKSQQLEQQEEVKYDDDVSNLSLVVHKDKLVGAQKYGIKVIQQENIEQNNEDDLFGQEEQEKGDEFVSIKPWLGAIKEPSNYYKDPLNQSKAPLVDLQLDYVYGYRSKDCRNNVKYLKSGSIVYNAAALGVTLDPSQNIQRFYNKHSDDVLCIDVHPDGIRVATGQTGAKPGIHIWDSNTQQTLCTFQGQLTKGVICLAFNTSGDKLAAVGLDDTHQLVIYDVQSKSRTGGVVIFQDRIGPDLVTDIKWKNDQEFTTFGINHLKMWTLSAGGLKSVRGILSKINSKYLCGAFNQDDCLVGAADGSLQIYQGKAQVHMIQCHELGKGLEALQVTKEYVLTGGRDYKINILGSKNSYKVILSITDFVKGSLLCEIKSIQLSPDSKSLLVGTAGSDIYELTTKDLKFTSSTKFSSTVKTLMRGHYSPNKISLNEVWGLATNPNDQDQFYTCSDDGTLRAWSISQRKMINMTKTNIDQTGNEIKVDQSGELSDSVKGRSIGVSPDGVYVVVGFKDGTLRLYDKELKQKMVMKCAKDWISDMKFSQDSQSLAIGSHDNSVYVYNFSDIVYNFSDMKLKNKPLRKHSSYITHLDFSNDGNQLHSNCGGYELLFWDVQKGSQILNGASALRDEKWNTWTSTLGWPVQGIWPENAKGTDINTVDRSHASMSGNDKPPDNYFLLATGDDASTIKLFRYPCIKKGSEFVEGKGHSSHITNVRFSNDDSFLFSAGGEDNCIIQWKVIKRR